MACIVFDKMLQSRRCSPVERNSVAAVLTDEYRHKILKRHCPLVGLEANSEISRRELAQKLNIKEKVQITLRFMQQKVQAYEVLKREIELLQQEVSGIFVAVNPSPNIQSPATQKWMKG